MQKYDFIKKQYTPYTPPQNGHCDIMVHANEELNCAACGRTINEHNAYTSAAIQNDCTLILQASSTYSFCTLLPS